jgi:endo-1,4-beta-xylanase
VKTLHWLILFFIAFVVFYFFKDPVFNIFDSISVEHGIDERIERYRKSDVSVVVTDAHGIPITDAQVKIDQVRHAFLFGAYLDNWETYSDPHLTEDYRKQFAEVFNLAAVPFLWWMYEPKAGETHEQQLMNVARWCKDQGITVMGHPLAWNFKDPDWLPNDVKQNQQLQMNHIHELVSHFAGLIDRWVVVNEATTFDRPKFVSRAPKLSAVWSRMGQVEFARA